MRKLEFVDKVINLVELRVSESISYWRHPRAIALGQYALHGQDVHFAAITYARNTEEDGVQGWQVNPRALIATAPDDESTRLWSLWQLRQPAKTCFDPMDRWLTAHQVGIVEPGNDNLATVTAEVPFGDITVPGRLGTAVLHITNTLNLE